MQQPPPSLAPSLADAEWLNAPATRAVFALLDSEGGEGRVVGGAVRNALIGVPVSDVDFATTLTPDRVAQLAEAAGMKVVPTGIDHGTVTLVVGGRAFEVTTLREDIATDGRHAVVRFGHDWTADAERRDFTVNALSVDAAGVVHDPIGGYADIVARRIRFIGDADRRIAEDRLRILRLFRFHADYGAGDVDPAGLAAAMRARNGLRDLSAERIGAEMRRIVVSRGNVAAVTVMQEAGILPIVLGGIAFLAQFGRAVRAATAAGAVPDPAPRLANLACRVEEDGHRVSERLRLANAERDRLLATLATGAAFAPFPDERAARGLLYRSGEQAFRDGVFYGFAWSTTPPGDAWKNLYHLPDRWTTPRFPLRGRDIVAAGVDGPAVGTLLRDLEAWWQEQDFAPDEAALRARLKQMIAARR
jgi:tRNA nucleotidyltransferase/poly(A) polymerase